ncbi:hypothetical protein HZC30_04065 [Candidatus Woesearchaeota archaeon]|nr:hypothetical protein [Candidatus Woesearchaeota archaeon]
MAKEIEQMNWEGKLQRYYSLFSVPYTNLEDTILKSQAGLESNVILRTWPSIQEYVARTIQAYHRQEVQIQTITPVMGRQRNSAATVSYALGDEQHSAFIKGFDFVMPSLYIRSGALLPMRPEVLKRENYEQENLLLPLFYSHGCFTPQYLGSFESDGNCFILLRKYDAITFDKQVQSLAGEKLVAGLAAAASTLGKFHVRATAHLDELITAMKKNQIPTWNMTNKERFESLWLKWHSLRYPYLGALSKENLNELDSVRKAAIGILTGPEKYILHYDMWPWNMLYNGNGQDHDPANPSLLIIDLEQVKIPTGPVAVSPMYDLSRILVWSETDLGSQLTEDEENQIIRQYLQAVNEETPAPTGKLEDTERLRQQILAGKLAAFDVRRWTEYRAELTGAIHDDTACSAASQGSERTWQELRKIVGK